MIKNINKMKSKKLIYLNLKLLVKNKVNRMMSKINEFCKKIIIVFYLSNFFFYI